MKFRSELMSRTLATAVLAAVAATASAEPIIIQEFARAGTGGTAANLSPTGSEWVELVLTESMTAAMLDTWMVGDANGGSRGTKEAAIRLNNMLNISSVFYPGTIICVSGNGPLTAAADTTYDPIGGVSGNWGLVLKYTAAPANLVDVNAPATFNLHNSNDVPWVDTVATGTTLTANGFGVAYAGYGGTLGANTSADVAISAAPPSGGLSASLTTAITGVKTATNWNTSTSPSTPGAPNGGANTTYFQNTLWSDTDGDGVPQYVEALAPNSGDGNGDSIADGTQNRIASVPNAINLAYQTITAPVGTTLSDVRSEYPPTPLPLDVTSFPVGLVRFRVNGVTPGGTINVTIKYANTLSPQPTGYWKRSGGTYTPYFGTGKAVWNQATNTMTLTLTDGGQGDMDGVVNGSILDPGGPGAGGTIHVDLTSFTAAAPFAGAPVTIAWSTAAELDNAGFRVKNAATGEIIGDFVSAEGNAAAGSSYSVVDTAPLAAGETRQYVLEDIDLSGTTTTHGPVTATITGTASAVEGWTRY